ncbi:FMN-binding protein [Tepidibacter hydrothermalis]|uniref:FMN-binding protein n=1 Tax=Tepidibacter hydrothermalis TaxID=3036126 RepID=A0ABY8EEL9_9FIRM|nr:FMN-binding protein [Tepidibacter hydrothermalis]WFD11221.1 FMN-binding protein [Tepidibacter hydrothermalis]
MKKIACIVALGLSVITFAGCAKDSDVESTYKNGVYEASADKWEYGSEKAIVTIQDDKIKDIDLKRLDTDGNEVDYNMWTGQEVDGNVFPNLKEYRTSMKDEMIEKQTYEVDSIAGATVTTDNWKIAVQRALEEAKN